MASQKMLLYRLDEEGRRRRNLGVVPERGLLGTNAQSNNPSGRDTAAITVNRWPHGYAYEANSLFDREVKGRPPYEIGRKRCGRVTIANSDAAWNAYAHEAIDQAWRAIKELKST